MTSASAGRGANVTRRKLASCQMQRLKHRTAKWLCGRCARSRRTTDQPIAKVTMAASRALSDWLTIYMYFLSQTLFRYRLLDLNELLGKMVVLSTFVLIL